MVRFLTGAAQFAVAVRFLTGAAPFGRPSWRSFRSGGVGVAGVLLAVAVTGCTYTGGELLYNLGIGRASKVEAAFELTDGPVLILIDDPGGRVDWPPARRHLFEALSQELLRHKAAQRIVPLETVEHLRQSVSDFEKRGAREIGELAEAEQVLWLEVQQFLASEEIEDASMAAYMSVAVKVLNVLERERASRVRLWPDSPGGHTISVSMSGSEVSMARTKDGVAKELAARVGRQVARLFYAYRPGDFEKTP